MLQLDHAALQSGGGGEGGGKGALHINLDHHLWILKMCENADKLNA